LTLEESVNVDADGDVDGDGDGDALGRATSVAQVPITQSSCSASRSDVYRYAAELLAFAFGRHRAPREDRCGVARAFR